MTAGQDTLASGGGQDLIFGDSLAFDASMLALDAGIASRDVSRVKDAAADAIADMTELGHHHHDWHWWHRDGDDGFQVTGGADLLDGGAGDDVMLGQRGRDTLRGGDGADYLIGGGEGDALDGGPGSDTEKNGHDTSSTLASRLTARLIDWSGTNNRFGAAKGLKFASAWVPGFTLELDDAEGDRAFVITLEPR